MCAKPFFIWFVNTLGGSIKTMRPRNGRGTTQYVNDIRHCCHSANHPSKTIAQLILFKPWSAWEHDQQQCASLRSKHVKSATRMSVTDRVMQVASMTCHASGVSDNCNPNWKSGLPKLKVPHHLFATQQALRPLAMQALATLKCAWRFSLATADAHTHTHKNCYGKTSGFDMKFEG